MFKALLGSDPELSTMQPDPEKPGQRDMEDLLLAVLPKCKFPVFLAKGCLFYCPATSPETRSVDTQFALLKEKTALGGRERLTETP